MDPSKIFDARRSAGLNAVFGSGWADPVATLTVASLR
jgi:hypothetical protein